MRTGLHILPRSAGSFRSASGSATRQCPLMESIGGGAPAGQAAMHLSRSVQYVHVVVRGGSLDVELSFQPAGSRSGHRNRLSHRRRGAAWRQPSGGRDLPRGPDRQDARDRGPAPCSSWWAPHPVQTGSWVWRRWTRRASCAQGRPWARLPRSQLRGRVSSRLAISAPDRSSARRRPRTKGRSWSRKCRNTLTRNRQLQAAT